MELKLNKIDKCFLISAILILVLLALSFLATLIFSILNAEIFLIIIFGFVVLITFLLLPISILIQIITLLIKIFSKDKTKKDWLIILINLISIFVFCLVLLMLYAAAANPLL